VGIEVGNEIRIAIIANLLRNIFTFIIVSVLRTMKKLTFAAFWGMLSLPIMSQVSGNATWNENNRFKNNNTYSAPVPADMDQEGVVISYDANLNKRRDKQMSRAGKPMATTSYQWNIPNGMNPISSSNEATNIQIHILKNATPTAYTAIFHINQAGEKVSELDSNLNRRLRKFVALGKEIGLKQNDFYTDMIALVPIFRKEKKLFSSTYVEVPKGFEIQKNVHIRYDHAWQLDRLFSMAAQCEIYDLIKVEYHFDSMQAAQSEMRKKALELLKLRTAHLKSTGINVDTCFRTLTESIQQVDPIDQYKPYQPLAISAITDDATTPETASRPNRSTLFHNRMSEGNYDAVINPSPLEPSIQITYTAYIHFERKLPVVQQIKTQNRTKLMMVTPQGQITEKWLD
jgi:uncharacterized protein YggE